MTSDNPSGGSSVHGIRHDTQRGRRGMLLSSAYDFHPIQILPNRLSRSGGESFLTAHAAKSDVALVVYNRKPWTNLKRLYLAIRTISLGSQL